MACIQFVELTFYNKLAYQYGFFKTEIKETHYDLTEALRSFVPEFAIISVAAMLKRYKVLLQICTPLPGRHIIQGLFFRYP